MFKSGYISILGKPNAGKSTLLNALVGEKVAIVSWRPQTTRNKIVGIMNGEDSQVVFIDTPGIHSAKNQLGEYMMKSVRSAIDGVDGIIYVIAADKGIDDKDMSFIDKYSLEVPTIVAINKVDLVERERVYALMDKLNNSKAIIVPIAAERGKNLDVLKEELLKFLPEGQQYYPEDMITDKSVRFMVGEIIREKAMRLLSDEVPYGIGIAINKFKEKPNGIVEIDADVVCEKAAHKPIVIGKGGEMLKRIGTSARIEIEKLVDSKVFLQLWVRVKEDWRDSEYLTNELGYDKKDI